MVKGSISGKIKILRLRQNEGFLIKNVYACLFQRTFIFP